MEQRICYERLKYSDLPYHCYEKTPLLLNNASFNKKTY